MATGRFAKRSHEIVELIRKADIILGTGHLSIAETIAIVRLAHERGVRKIIVTHPEAPFIKMPIAIQQDLAALGAYLERCYVFTTELLGETISVSDIAHANSRRWAQNPPFSPPIWGSRRTRCPWMECERYLNGLVAAGLDRVCCSVDGFGKSRILVRSWRNPERSFCFIHY